jgi:prepilin-type processing-associated H-X9-DG protein
MILFAALMLLPAMAQSRVSSRTLQCLSNAKRLAAAVMMYTADNQALYPPNPDDGNTSPGYDWVPGLACIGCSGIFSPDLLKNPSYFLLASYLGTNAAVLQCPEDPRFGTYQGSDPLLLGKTIRATRSVSMNGGVGTADAQFLQGGGHSGRPESPVKGTWLTGSPFANVHDHPWATFGKTSDFRVVPPSQIFVIADEDPYSINDGALGVIAGVSRFIDFPATFHNHGCTFSFCDGHVELHVWMGNAIVLTPPISFAGRADTGLDHVDWVWLKDHSTVLMQ